MINTIPYPGSKRRCVSRLLPHLGAGDLLASPFAGMAALEVAALEAGAFRRAILSDANPYVVAVLRACQTDPGALYRRQVDVRAHIGGDPIRHRDAQRAVEQASAAGESDVEVGGLALGVSCWTYSRLWVRMSSEGRLNASTDPRRGSLVPLATLERYHAALKGAKVWLSSWEWIQDLRGGTIYLDPPYLGKGGFTAYTRAGWRQADGERLADVLGRLTSCRVVLSEQDPGGGPMYVERIGAVRPIEVVRLPLVRNVRGDQISEVREEVTLVAPSTL